MPTGENLVLLVGTSPLPNYLVIRYFVERGVAKKVTLIFSKTTEKQYGTEKYAEAIRSSLGRLAEQIEWCLIPLNDISSPKAIINDLGSAKCFGEHIHFNFTGGTKFMVMQVYAFLESLKIAAIRYSYLNAKTFKIHYYQPPNALKENTTVNDEPSTGDLRKLIKIDIDTLLALHLYKRSKSSFYTANQFEQFNDALSQLERLIKKGEIYTFMDWWIKLRKASFAQEVLRSKQKYLKYIFASVNGQKCVELFETMPQACLDLLNSFPEEKRINEGNSRELWIPDDQINNTAFKQRLYSAFSFLDGKWLEYYIYDQLLKTIDWLEPGKNFGWSLEATKLGESRKFELDLYLINGYQLMGISVTTSAMVQRCKLKGFEIIHRVRQIGGEEGVAVLVTALEAREVEILQKDLEYETGAKEDRFIIFGINDWEKIGERISSMIKETNR